MAPLSSVKTRLLDHKGEARADVDTAHMKVEALDRHDPASGDFRTDFQSKLSFGMVGRGFTLRGRKPY